MRPITFETAYPKLPFAPLVALGLEICRLLAGKRPDRRTPDALPAHV